METLLVLLILASLVMFAIGMISPKRAVPFNLPKKRGVVALIYLGAFVLFFILFGTFYADENAPTPSPAKQQSTSQEQSVMQSSEQPATPQSSTQPAEQSKQQQTEESSIGKTFQVGNFEYTINGVRFRKTIGDSFYSETADGVYMLVDLTIKNISRETRTLDGYMFIVTDMDGIRYEYSSDGMMILDNDLFLKSCQPKIATKGVLLFEVPEKGAYYIHLTGNAWGTKTIRVLLK